MGNPSLVDGGFEEPLCVMNRWLWFGILAAMA